LGKRSKEKGARFEVGGILVIAVRGALRLRLEVSSVQKTGESEMFSHNRPGGKNMTKKIVFYLNLE